MNEDEINMLGADTVRYGPSIYNGEGKLIGFNDDYYKNISVDRLIMEHRVATQRVLTAEEEVHKLGRKVHTLEHDNNRLELELKEAQEELAHYKAIEENGTTGKKKPKPRKAND